MTLVDVTSKDPFFSSSADMIRDPYPFYDQLRQQGNLLWSGAGEKRWIAVGYNTSVTMLSDYRLGVEVPEALMESLGSLRHSSAHADLITGLTKFLLSQDPPQHTRVRKLVNKAFTRAEIAQMTHNIEGIIAKLIDRVAASGEMDLIADFAFPLPLTIVCGVLGFPESDHDSLKRWTHAITPTAEPLLKDGVLDEGGKAAKEMFDYFRAHIQDRRQNPRADLISALVQAEEEGDSLNMDELLANMLLLVIAGHETTVNLIGNGMLALLEHPHEMEKLRNNADLIPSAIEECLRFQSPLQVTDRYVKEDLELEGQSLKKGDRVAVVLGAANRDSQQFENPGAFNVERHPNKHLAFGNGIHFCVGAPLARIEVKLAFEQLLFRLKNISLAADKVHYKPSMTFRGLASLPIKFDAHVPAIK